MSKGKGDRIVIPTAQQQIIYDILSGHRKLRSTESGNISVDAVAGSGKTTTAVQAAKYASKRYKRIAFTAFNKGIAEELGKKLQGSAESSTLHSLGMRLVKSKLPSLTVDSGGQKYRKIATKEFPSYFESKGTRSFLKPQYASLFGILNLIRSENFPIETLTQEVKSQISNACDIQGISLPSREYVDEVIGAAFRCLEIGSDWSVISEMDFPDMIWLPVKMDIASKDFDLLFADEAQDFNRVQQQLILRVSENTVIVGDPYQSIMGWAGADSKSFRNLTNALHAKELPLSVCWRCPTSHLELARKLVPHIEASPSATEGVWDTIDSYTIAGRVAPGDLIICRNNAPLISVAYNLMRQKIPCMVKGKDIGADIINLIEKLDPFDMKDLNSRLSRWKEREQKKLLDRDAHESAFDALEDKVQTILELSSECDTVSEMTKLCEDLFKEKSDGEKIQLSSIHRAKGLEAETVVLLRPDLCCARAKDPEAYQQEKNLLYVGLTRAKRNLFVAGGVGGCGPDFPDWIEDVARRNMPRPKFV
jgi:superfamily I DNA/RNA helicase